MSKRQYCFMLILALLAGLLGGVVSNYLLIGQPVLAERTGVCLVEEESNKVLRWVLELPVQCSLYL